MTVFVWGCEICPLNGRLTSRYDMLIWHASRFKKGREAWRTFSVLSSNSWGQRCDVMLNAIGGGSVVNGMNFVVPDQEVVERCFGQFDERVHARCVRGSIIVYCLGMCVRTDARV